MSSEPSQTPGRTPPAAGGRSVSELLLKGLALLALWLLLSGHYDAFHIGLGVLSVLLVGLLNWRLPRPDPVGEPRLRVHRLFVYLPWLLWQIVLSGLHVARLVLHPQLPTNPRMLRFRSRQPCQLARVILANSITLTPGTLTVELEDDVFLVHALDEQSGWSLVFGTMQRQVARLFTDEASDWVEDLEIQQAGQGDTR